MLNKIYEVIKHEPAIMSAIVALLGTIVLAILDAIQLAGGEWVVIITGVLGAAGVTRKKVAPV